MNRLVAIVGPTAVGKSQLALRLAQAFDGEIVSADSRQVYHHMDIGTAKPSPQELSLVPHHLINIVNPDEDFSLAQYQELAYTAIENIQHRDKLPLLVGGSGLYIWSVLEGWGIPQVPPDLEFRHSLEEKAATVGKDELHQELKEVDPVAAQKIDQRNVRRTIRALEVCRGAEAPFSKLQHKKAPSFTTLIMGLTTDRGELYRRIDLRVDKMIKQGLVAEVKKLVNIGYDCTLPAMSGIGYKQIGMFLGGELTLAAAIQQIKFETHRFVRHQYNWFRLESDRIEWFDILGTSEWEITTRLAAFIGGRSTQ
ncbi:MAG TPA: tRNA (adenosine(37)-N6)-dimethylallyltransferase MiaA [Dehalococcoidia bacterium]|jgi:tRNA dimethylallyltransferase|nr:tRNA (adenosine(37)-N6)-dimethylallyltransferase MiaA [Dehalococcoidia bacterium]